MATRMCESRNTAICLLVVAAILFLVSLITLAVFPSIYQKQLKEDIQLVQGSIEYDIWKDLPIPIYERLYFFNITNGDDFTAGKEKLSVSQVGPYTYKGQWVKDNIQWYPNGTVSYQEKRTYEFVQEESVGSEDDEIFSLNGPMVLAADVVKNWNSLEKFAVGVYFAGHGETIVTKKSVRQLSYDGYEDPIIKIGKYIKKHLPFKHGIFSWLYGKNDTYDGTFTVFSGEDDITKLNVINKWNGDSKVNFWSNDSCNMINGSSGEMGPPIREGQKELTFFQSLFCRSVTFTYSGEAIHKGVRSKRFIATENVFGNESVNPDNYCFATKPHLRSGVLDISPCQFDVPIIISFPHFYLADPYYLTQVDGLSPDSATHLSYIDVEPRTGISMDIAIRFQVNLELQQVDGLGQFEDIDSGVFPLFWVEVRASITDELADFLKTSLDRPKFIVYSVIGIALLISAVLLIFGTVIMCRSKEKCDDKEDEPILDCNGDVKTYYTIDKERGDEKRKAADEEKEKPSASDLQYAEQCITSSSEVTPHNPVINQHEVTAADDDPLLDGEISSNHG